MKVNMLPLVPPVLRCVNPCSWGGVSGYSHLTTHGLAGRLMVCAPHRDMYGSAWPCRPHDSNVVAWLGPSTHQDSMQAHGTASPHAVRLTMDHASTCMRMTVD